jgi:hypothetical protein
MQLRLQDVFQLHGGGGDGVGVVKDDDMLNFDLVRGR